MTNEPKPSPQESLIYLKIQQAKAQGVRFPSVSSMFHAASIDNSSMSAYFVKPEEVDYLRYETNVKATDLGEAMLLMIPLSPVLTCSVQQMFIPFQFYHLELQ